MHVGTLPLSRGDHRGTCVSPVLPFGVGQTAMVLYATFWLDPFGIMLEVVCHRAERASNVARRTP